MNMNKILIALVLIFSLSGCNSFISTTNPDGSISRGERGSILWITSAPIEYAVEYMESFDTWRICEIWDETLSSKNTSTLGKYGGGTGMDLRMRRVLAKTLEKRGEDPMLCRSTSTNISNG